MRLVTLGLLGLALALAVLLPGQSEGDVDDFRYCDQPVRDGVVVYVGMTDGWLSVEFRNEWSSYSIFLEGDCFANDTYWQFEGDFRPGDWWRVDLPIANGTPPGRYRVSMRVPGWVYGEEVVHLPLNFTLDYVEPLVFRSFHVHRAVDGSTTLDVEVETFVNVEALDLGLDVGDGYTLDPGTIRMYSLRPGVYHLESRVIGERLSGPPSTVSYRGLLIIRGQLHELPPGKANVSVTYGEDNATTYLLAATVGLAVVVGFIIYRLLRLKSPRPHGTDGQLVWGDRT